MKHIKHMKRTNPMNQMKPTRAVQMGAGALVIVLALAGLSRGYRGEGMDHGGGTGAPARGMAVVSAAVLAGDGPGTTARLSVRNDTGRDDVLLGITTGAGDAAALTSSGATVTPLRIAAGDTLQVGDDPVLAITGLYGPLAPGQTVALSLDFEHAGAVLVEAPVVAK